MVPEAWTLPWWKEFLSAGQSVIVSATVIVTAWIAVHNVNAWRRQEIGKRRREIAEQVLTTFYEVRDVLRWVRSPASFGGEGAKRPARDTDASDAVRRTKDAYFIPIERLQAKAELFARLQTQRHLIVAYFGDAAAKPFDDIWKVHVDVVTSAEMLIETADDRPSDLDKNSIAEWKKDIWGTGRAGRDNIAPVIDAAVAEIERICRPILSEGRGRD